MISIPTQRTYPTVGSLDMLTVNFVGNRSAAAQLVRGDLGLVRPEPGGGTARLGVSAG